MWFKARKFWKSRVMEGTHPAYHILRYIKIKAYSLLSVYEKNDRTVEQNRNPEMELTTYKWKFNI